ncbi:ABC transporter substrate-binding protein [Bosea sp. (in: a-proteobacteria)]|uniref:ABC transporter substrate-binding protein n=1 Tax=Bosea sp. (in: a-proteobacteria) TaxID=1871050 RepID=UPI001217C758|nr:ABC transporter substrate-binding protein [Bosea sp. (in: a-proteobacteria)]TAJ29340.1 MAG: ABC transporter substrate-binding protein [Bosea sp. (in: a-proteobacteria)]
MPRLTMIKSPSRRSVLLGAAAVIAAPSYIRPGWAQGKRIVVVNSGGAMGDAKRRALYDPFTKATGIEVVTSAGPDLAKMKAQVDRKDVEWDVTDLADAWVPAGVRLGLLERVDTSIVNFDGCIPQAKHDYAVGGTIYTGGIAFPTNRLDGKVARTWPEFWDVKGVPGRRGLRNRVTDTLEIALMGDGVPASQVYPCDVERAFKALDKIKPHVSHWIPQTAQTVSLIQGNETDFTFTYTTRVKDLQAAKVPIDFSFRQNILGIGWIGVLKGTKNRDAAMRFLAFTMDRDRQVELANLSGDAPTFADALAKVDPAVKKWLPDITSPDNLFVNAGWWDSRIDELNLRFKEWLLT